MRRKDGRIEPGQSLRGAISARAWNRAQDAADVVLGRSASFAAAAIRYDSLPRLIIRLRSPGFFGEVKRLYGFSQGTASASMMDVSAAPEDNQWNYSEDEKRLPAFGELYWTGGTGNVQFATEFDNDPPLAFCLDNDSYQYAVSGFAIARVRVFNYFHRRARMASRFPGSTALQDNEADGCLDSSFFGSVRIVGYAVILNDQLEFRHATNNTLVWPNYEFRWALVQF